MDVFAPGNAAPQRGSKQSAQNATGNAAPQRGNSSQPRATPWVRRHPTNSPCKGKSMSYRKLMLLPLQGEYLNIEHTQGAALGEEGL